MNITLGGKLSILMALTVAGLTLMQFLAGAGAYHVQVYGGVALYCLTAPIIWVSDLFDGGGDQGVLPRIIFYLLLAIPYSLSSVTPSLESFAGFAACDFRHL